MTFVQRQSDRLILDNRTFRIVGANIYYFAYSTEAEQLRLLDITSDFGLNVLRIWAFNDFIPPTSTSLPGDADISFQFFNPETGTPQPRDGPFGLERLDRAVKLAADRGIRLILTLTNYNPDYGGIPQYARWLGLANANDFYRRTAAITTFQNWIAAILTRQNTLTNLSYADDPTILAWEIANEPRCASDSSGTRLLTSWLTEISAFIRTIAPRQLIAAGDEGFFDRDRAG